MYKEALENCLQWGQNRLSSDVLINEVVCIFTVEYNAAVKINEVENENDYMK